MGASIVGWGLFGVVLSVLAVLAWTGRWSWWARSVHMGNLPITVMPGLGFFLVVLTVYPMLPDAIGVLLGLLAFPGVIAGFVLAAWTPSWYGPKWYRLRDTEKLDLSIPGNASAVAAAGVSPWKNSRLVAEGARNGERLLGSRSVALVGPEWGRPSAIHTDGVVWGRLLFYPDELVFAADEADDATRRGPTVRSLPASAITQLCTVANNAKRDLRRPMPFPHVLAGTGEQAWRVETQRPRRLMADLREHYAAQCAG